jgi:hypothetical protein
LEPFQARTLPTCENTPKFIHPHFEQAGSIKESLFFQIFMNLSDILAVLFSDLGEAVYSKCHQLT